MAYNLISTDEMENLLDEKNILVLSSEPLRDAGAFLLLFKNDRNDRKNK
jgi:hypothetical protein